MSVFVCVFVYVPDDVPPLQPDFNSFVAPIEVEHVKLQRHKSRYRKEEASTAVGTHLALPSRSPAPRAVTTCPTPAGRRLSGPDNLVLHDNGRNVSYTGAREDTTAKYALLVGTDDTDAEGRPVFDVMPVHAWYTFERCVVLRCAVL